jgi:CHAD domain-containing protein
MPASLQDRLGLERAEAERAVNARLTMARVHRMFAHLAAYQAACDGAACPPLPEVAGQQLSLRFQQVCSASQLRRDSSLEQLHATRRAIRRFRYDIEAVSLWLPAPKAAVKGVKAAQDAFGTVSDTAALVAWLQARGAGAERETVAAALPELVDAALASLEPLLQSELGAMSSAAVRS